jgi:ribA/ribD-fused uncharacterized protein
MHFHVKIYIFIYIDIFIIKIIKMENNNTNIEGKESINFYRVSDAYGCFSNFWNAEIEIDGIKYPTTEHYFQSVKFNNDPEYAEQIRLAKSPMDAAKLGRDKTKTRRSDWDESKYQVMRKACMAKFTQHENLRKNLLETGDKVLVEHTKNDKVWADGGDGTGLNWLGKVLMEVREELKNQN